MSKCHLYSFLFLLPSQISSVRPRNTSRNPGGSSDPEFSLSQRVCLICIDLHKAWNGVYLFLPLVPVSAHHYLKIGCWSSPFPTAPFACWKNFKLLIKYARFGSCFLLAHCRRGSLTLGSPWLSALLEGRGQQWSHTVEGPGSFKKKSQFCSFCLQKQNI